MVFFYDGATHVVTVKTFTFRYMDLRMFGLDPLTSRCKIFCPTVTLFK